MAANDDYPNGTIATSGSAGIPSGNGLSCTFGAVGLQWVLTDVNAELWQSTEDFGYIILANGVSLAAIFCDSSGSSSGSASWSGELVFPINTAVTVELGANVQSGYGFIEAFAYLI